MNKIKLVCWFNLAWMTVGLFAGATSTWALELKSPDGRVVLNFDLKDIGNLKGCPIYNVSYDGRPLLGDSRLGLELRNDFITLADKFHIIHQQTSTSDTTWKPLLAERETIRDHYNQLVVDLQQGEQPWSRLLLTFRAYNEGIAFNYTLPKEDQHIVNITHELTQFTFTGDYTTWAVYTAQADYTRSLVPLSKVSTTLGAERPLTVRVADNLYVAITEARIADGARMKLRHSNGLNNTLEVFLDAERGVNGEEMATVPFTTPWRVVMVADSPGKLLEQNYLVLNLNDPCALEDTSWIKPGKVIRDIAYSTQGSKACIDFAVKHNLQYVMLDGGWYGNEYDPASDASAVHLDPKRNPNPNALNLQEVIAYGNTKGIGVILYVNHLAMEKQLDEILPIYEKWGVKGVKYGFVNVGSQYWMKWLHEAIRKAAAHHLMVDIHDEFRNAGYQRTYPNLMTVEGICGNELFPSQFHNAMLPFTRFLTGPADYTYCWNDPRLKMTKAHQLALSTINFSPWQFLFWYDQPKNIRDEPALEYWDHLSTTWDETRVLQGDIGRRAVVARRKGAEWFVGAIAPVDGKFSIALDFLPAGQKFTAKIYSDQLPATGVKVEEQAVDNQSVLAADIVSNGGMAIHIFPQP